MSTLGFQTFGSGRDPVEDAVKELVSTKEWGGSKFIQMPMFFPGGTAVTVCVTRSSKGYVVSDHGFAYRELEAIGAERSFGGSIASIAERQGVEKDRRRILLEVPSEDISRAICDVAAASWSVVDKVYAAKDDAEDEDALEEELTAKLISLFGEQRVRVRETLLGSSSTEWGVSAVVRGENGRSVFQAVGNNPISVYRANTAFHDLASLETPPNLVAVVRRAAEMGPRLGLLTQAGRVIEEDQPDNVFVRMAG